MYSYCLGIRLNGSYQEVACKKRDNCPYYMNTDLSKALGNPAEYIELDTYNSNECLYYALSDKSRANP